MLIDDACTAGAHDELINIFSRRAEILVQVNGGVYKVEDFVSAFDAIFELVHRKQHAHEDRELLGGHAIAHHLLQLFGNSRLSFRVLVEQPARAGKQRLLDEDQRLRACCRLQSRAQRLQQPLHRGSHVPFQRSDKCLMAACSHRFHVGLQDLTHNADKLLDHTSGRRGRDYFEASYRLDLEFLLLFKQVGKDVECLVSHIWVAANVLG